MRLAVRALQFSLVLFLLFLGSCSLHSGFRPRGFGSADGSFLVGFGVALLAVSLFLIRRWFWASSATRIPPPLPNEERPTAYDVREDRQDYSVISDPTVLANYPVLLWAEKREPFRAWHPNTTVVPSHL